VKIVEEKSFIAMFIGWKLHAAEDKILHMQAR
jgi:hypothetical protein